MLKNRAIIDGIKNKTSLDLDNYKELLNGAGFMIRDYLTKKFDVYCKRISADCIGYDFVSENDLPLIDVVMGGHQDKWHWYLQSQMGKVLLVKFKYDKMGEFKNFGARTQIQTLRTANAFKSAKLKLLYPIQLKKFILFQPKTSLYTP